MVMVAVLHQHIVGGSRSLVDRPHQPQFREEIEGTVDGHPANLGILLAHQFDQFIGRHMPVAGDKHIEDGLAGGRQPVAVLFQGVADGG